jgi:hypothetical protein
MASTEGRNQVAILTFCSLSTMYNEATLKLLLYYVFFHTVVQVVREVQFCRSLKNSRNCRRSRQILGQNTSLDTDPSPGRDMCSSSRPRGRLVAALIKRR